MLYGLPEMNALVEHRTLPIVVADIGGTTVKIGAVSGGTIYTSVAKHDTGLLNLDDPAETLACWLSAFVANNGLCPGNYVVTVPASVSADFERVLKAANVLCLEGRALRAELAARLAGVPVHLERDVDVLLQGEIAYHALPPEATVLGVFVGTGIGASCVWHGQVYRGNGQGMQLGLAPIRGAGLARPWARRDTLEVYASGRAIQEFAESRDIAVTEFFSNLSGDDEAAAWFETCLRDQIMHIATAVALMGPDVLILGGGVLDLPGYPRDRLEAGLRAYAPQHETGRYLRVMFSNLGWQAALLGSEQVVARRAKTFEPAGHFKETQ